MNHSTVSTGLSSVALEDTGSALRSCQDEMSLNHKGLPAADNMGLDRRPQNPLLGSMRLMGERVNTGVLRTKKGMMGSLLDHSLSKHFLSTHPVLGTGRIQGKTLPQQSIHPFSAHSLLSECTMGLLSPSLGQAMGLGLGGTIGKGTSPTQGTLDMNIGRDRKLWSKEGSRLGLLSN